MAAVYTPQRAGGAAIYGDMFASGAPAPAPAPSAATTAAIYSPQRIGGVAVFGSMFSSGTAAPLDSILGGGFFGRKPWWLRTSDDEDKPGEKPQIEAEIEAMVAEIPSISRANVLANLVRKAKRARDNGAPLDDAFAAQRARTKTRQRRDAEMLLLMD